VRANGFRLARRSMMILGGAAVGGVVGLLFAPATGARSRALLRDKLLHYRKLMSRRADSKSRHLKNWAQGMEHRVSKRLHREIGAAQDSQIR